MSFWSVIFLVAAGQGIFLAVLLLFARGKYANASKILSLFILLFSLNTLENVAYWTGYQLQIPHVAGSTRGFIFLFGPLLWFYALSIVDEKWKLSWKDFLHFIPFVGYLIFRLPYYLLDAESKRLILETSSTASPWVVAFVRVTICAHLGIYSILLFRLRGTGDASPLPNRIGIGLLVYTFTFVAYYAMVYTIGLNLNYDYVISFVGVVAIYQVGYLAMARPEMLHGFLRKEIQTKKYEKSALTEEEAQHYRQQIHELLTSEKVYLATDLRLNDLATRLSISPNYVSQVINEQFGKSFNELLTEYRVQEAIRRLEDPNNDEKLLAIALNSGFNNRTSFNLAFKKYAGCSPKEYKEKMREKV